MAPAPAAPPSAPRRSSSRPAVLDLPRVIQSMPRRATHGVSGRPRLAGARRARGPFAARVGRHPIEERGADAPHLRPAAGVPGLPGLGPEAGEIDLLGLQDVADDRVELATASARAL